MFAGFNGAKKKEDGKPTETSNNNNETTKGSGNNESKSMHGFDPSSLERAAKAARELDASKNSREAVRLINAQEVTKQKELEAERAKYQAMQQELAIRRVAEEEQSASRTLEKKSAHDRKRIEYSDELERKRYVEQINAQRHLQDEERKKNEESLRKQEEIRRKTLDHEATLRQQTEIARVKAEAEGRILQERTNHDLILAKNRLDAAEYRETVLSGIKLAGSIVGEGVLEFVTDQQKLFNVVGLLTATAFGVYAARTSTSVIGRYIESRLGKPSLVRETTKMNALQMIRTPIVKLKSFLKPTYSKGVMNEIVLEKSLEDRLRRIAVSTVNTKKNKAPFRHLLLHGPPGTGKTMFAKGLARESGLHYAIMTGGDVAPLGKDGVTEIHKIFDWANTSSKGVLIFVDEADAFFRKRSTEKISEDLRNALNAFLYRTGEASTKFMIVYASNQPEQFDWAINDRIDEMVSFKLPSLEERIRMIALYIDKYLLNPIQGSRKISVQGVDENLIKEMAISTEGFSGREVSKLAIAWQAAAYGSHDAKIDEELFRKVLNENVLTKKQKKAWVSKEYAECLARDT